MDEKMREAMLEKTRWYDAGTRAIFLEGAEDALKYLREQQELEIERLRPMDEAPRDGTKIIVKERNQDGNWYRLCRWKKPYNIFSRCGAWMHLCDGDAVSVITERRAIGWMPEPRDP